MTCQVGKAVSYIHPISRTNEANVTFTCKVHVPYYYTRGINEYLMDVCKPECFVDFFATVKRGFIYVWTHTLSHSLTHSEQAEIQKTTKGS